MASFADLSTPAGLKELDAYLLTRSYISGYEASKDDLAVYSAIKSAPKGYVNVARWYSHITNLLGSRFAGASSGVTIAGGSSSAAAAAAPAPSAAPAAADDDDDDDDDDLDLFSGPTEEEKAASADRAAKAVAAGKKPKEAGKSSVLIDIKPWDDETDMVKLEASVRAVQMEGLTWGAGKLQPVGYGIKKLTIMMTIVDDLVSVDGLIEDHLTVGDCAEYIQSCDIVAFNKI